MTKPVWYADPALYETRQLWYFEITTTEFAGYDAEKKEAVHKDVIHRIGRADIIAALGRLAKRRPRRVMEIMQDSTDVDLADIFFQTLLFGDYCYFR